MHIAQSSPSPRDPDTEVADVLALLCAQIGETVENGLAARRYALTGDRRALAGTLL
ncbi:hypothetical protein [Streptomyces sp. LaBMicrA B280]|uniref:hypothetical protein n=1 Tax=Streptomyces sp. LaBMicrA B280 TaxID=3391001 RepID=UPI003BA79DCF